MQIQAHQTLTSFLSTAFANFWYISLGTGQTWWTRVWTLRVHNLEWTWILFLEFEDKQERQLKEPSRAQWESFRPNESHFHFLVVLAQPPPPPPHPPWPRLNNRQTSRHHWAGMNCFSIAEECSALHIHSQTVQGRISCQIHKYMYFLASLLATTEHIWLFAKHLEDWIQ